MNNEDFNMSMRKFLKRVGVTSQQQIEEAVRTARAAGKTGGAMQVRMTLRIDDIDLTHVVEGTIETGS
jgi:uncharacterized protein DUF6494